MYVYAGEEGDQHEGDRVDPVHGLFFVRGRFIIFLFAYVYICCMHFMYCLLSSLIICVSYGFAMHFYSFLFALLLLLILCLYYYYFTCYFSHLLLCIYVFSEGHEAPVEALGAGGVEELPEDLHYCWGIYT